ncbi:MAG: hypothetical protein ABL949_00285 [Fimbriimonadaceae bacterium]
MFKTLKIASAALAAVFASQYLTSDKQIEPVVAQAQAPLILAGYDLDTALQQKVTVDLDGTFDDVVKWLRSTGVNFVIADDTLAKRRVSVKLDNQPLREAMDAIAEAMGGIWQKKGEIYTFARSGWAGSFATPARPEAWAAPVPAMPMLNEKLNAKQRADLEKQLSEVPPMITAPNMTKEQRLKFEHDLGALKEGMKAFVFQGDELKELKKLGELKELKGLKGLQELKALEKLAPLSGRKGDVKVWVNGKELKPEEIEKMKRDGRVQLHFGDEKGLDAKTRKQIEEAMKSAQDQVKLYFKGDPFSDDTMFERVRQSARAAQSAERAAKEARTFTEESKKVTRDTRSAAKDAEKMAKEARVFTEQSQKVAKDSRAFSERAQVIRAEITDLKALMKSLTPAQRELQKSRGYLKASDLTPGQLKMLPVAGSGDWSFSFSIDGEKLSIRKN